ncbi:MAG: cobalamin-independent methionine synthase II family protein [Rhodospirillaceae bacterium]|nr:cobalamin-independent methionine synthase II family protein [Rhodospirillaceae bacterium]MBT6138777.1 cobalamin-independent methionine synthase II family protein [Rhodospirillaceae bacterium]
MRILTTHAGSLPRPQSLTQLYAWRADGKPVDESQLVAEGEAATDWVVERQRACGIDIPSDGEQLREAFFLYVQRRMSGFGGQWTRTLGSELENYPEFAEVRRAAATAKTAVSNFTPPMAVGPIEYQDFDANLDEIKTFKAALETTGDAFTDAFITAPSPGIVAKAMRNEFYPNDEAYLDALAAALRVEYRAAHEHGLMLQIDAPDLALERHLTYSDRPIAEFVAFVDQVVARINRALDGIPRDRVRLHVCWGNYEGPHDHDVALREILPSLLRAEVGTFMLPFANPRHQHEIKVFRELPLAPDQKLIVGVIDTTTNFVEHPEVVAERLERAADAIGDPTRILAGTDCGFDTSAGMGRVTADVVWAKLRAMREGADIASERLR